MKTYKIEITETLQKIVEVQAESLCDAIHEVATDYSNGKIVLYDNDFVGYEIKDYKEE